MSEPFNCWQCGACCKLVGLHPEGKDLDRGDLACKHLTSDNMCSIYDDRPDICSVRTMWEKEPLGLTWDGYKELTTEICKVLDEEVNGDG